MSEPSSALSSVQSVSHQKKVFFPNLDGIRFFLFFFVFLSHNLIPYNPLVGEPTWYEIIKQVVFNGGNIGVSFFFVLSGFLITYLLIKEKEFTGKIDVKSFYIRRALRIWPLYYFCVIFSFTLLPFLQAHFDKPAVENVNVWLCSTFLNNFNKMYYGPPGPTVSVLWSVAIEEQFYLVWPLLFFLAPKKHYNYIILGVLALSTAFRALYYNTLDINTHTLGVITDMAVGGLGAYLSIKSVKFLNFINNTPKWLSFIPYLGTLLILLFEDKIFDSNTFLFVSKGLIMSTVFIWVILDQNFCNNSLFKIGSLKRITKLGKYTYGLYCLHTFAVLITLVIVRKLTSATHSNLIWLMEIPLSLALSIFISWFSFTYFESWFLRLKTRFAYISKD